MLNNTTPAALALQLKQSRSTRVQLRHFSREHPAMTLDDSYRAVLTLEFPKALDLSEDSSAAIQTDGLFGSKFVEVQPGGSDGAIKSGGRISYVQDSVILEDLIATIVARAKTLRGEP